MQIKINDNISVPIYYQIYQQLKDSINNHNYLPGDQLPTERELNRILGVSRITIRKAIKDLVAEGYCYKSRGRGIFVSGGKIPLEVDHLKGMGSYIESMGLKIDSKIINKEVIESNTRITEKLEVPYKSNILHLKRLRLIDNKPLVIESTYLSLIRFRHLEKYDFFGSLYKIIREEYNIFPDHSKGTFINTLAKEQEANLLNIPLNYPITEKQAVVYDKKNIPIEFIHSTYHSNRFIFTYHSQIRNKHQSIKKI